jgi:hypothetical protein
VIIRIATEDQFELPEDAYQEVDDLDNEAADAVQAGDEQRFFETFGRMLDVVRSRGTKLGDEDLRESQVVLPPPDIDFHDAQEYFGGDEGAIPDSLVPRP